METTNPYMSLPGITADELTILQRAITGLNETQQTHFFNLYAIKRKSPENVKLFCILGIIIPGIQRFVLGQIAWGILFFFTGGLFLVMTVMDLVNYKKLALEYNRDLAYESLRIAQMAG
jgi:TM2 domain-containing membrane protein YozV